MKRFTATDKWTDPWYRSLNPSYKLLWLYLIDSCDNSGVWDKDMGLASFYIGVDLREEQVLNVLNNGKLRIVPLDDPRKWFIPEFITFQYGVSPLSKKCTTHQQVLDLLKDHEIDKIVKEGYVKGMQTVWKGYVTDFYERKKVSSHSSKKESNHSISSSNNNTSTTHVQEASKSISTNTTTNISTIIDNILLYWNDTRLQKVEVISKGRRDKFRERLKSGHFRENWRKAIDHIKDSQFCLGYSKQGWKATIDWFIANDNNYVKALEGKYDNKKEDPFSKY